MPLINVRLWVVRGSTTLTSTLPVSSSPWVPTSVEAMCSVVPALSVTDRKLERHLAQAEWPDLRELGLDRLIPDGGSYSLGWSAGPRCC